MNPAYESLISGVLTWLDHAGLVFLRLGAMMAFLPAFGEQSVPVRVKLGLTAAFTLVVAPAVPLGVFSPVAAGAEIVTGLFFGAMPRLIFWSLQIAGSVAAQSTSLSQIFGGGIGAEPQPAIAHVLTLAGICLAVLSGLHVSLAVYMVISFDLVPPGRWIEAEVIAQIGLAGVARIFSLGFSLAAPFLVLALLYNVTLGAINRAMPQLMVSFVGAPAITGGALALMAISAPLLLPVWANSLFGFLRDPSGFW